MKLNTIGNNIRVSALIALFALGGICQAVELTSSYPAPNAGDIPRSTSIYLRFNEPLDVDSLQGLTLHGPKGDVFAEFPTKRSAGLTSDLIELHPIDFLPANATYEVRGLSSVKSASGRNLRPFQLRFSTGATGFDQTQRLAFVPEIFDQTRSMTTVLFSGTLDVTSDPETGFLYIACFGKQSKFGEDGSMVVLRPSLRGEFVSADTPIAVATNVDLSPRDFGRKIFESQCLMCHQLNGEGLPGSFPMLAGSKWVLGEKRLGINIVLSGLNSNLALTTMRTTLLPRCIPSALGE